MDKETISKFKIGINGGLVGFVVATIAFGVIYPPNVQRVQTFQRKDNKSAVMRLYNKPGVDRILVEDADLEGYYIKLNEYLSTIPDKSDRLIEKGEIQKAVEWYE